jgi:hypothetical protein
MKPGLAEQRTHGGKVLGKAWSVLARDLGRKLSRHLAVSIEFATESGCRTWIRTMTNRSRVCCATVTPSGNPGREGEARFPAR